MTESHVFGSRLVTLESVAAVREKLISMKQRPSVRLIMRELGGGSPNDIAPLLRELEKKQPAAKKSSIK